MKAKALITISSFLFILFSCEKDKSDVTYGVTYMKSEIQPLTDIQYYSSNGNINSKSLFPWWITNDSGRFSYLTTSILSPGFLDSLRFINPQEAIYKYYNS